MKLWIFSCLFIFTSALRTPDRGVFTVISSQMMHFRETFTVLVTSKGYQTPTTLSVSLLAKLDDGERYENTRNITLDNRQKSFSLQRLFFDMKNQKLGDYYVQAVSRGDKKFNYSLPLHISTKKFSVFVQTDKAMYKPGDKVLFRILTVDSQTRPYHASPVNIFIQDGAGNRIKQFDNVKLVNGVYKGELQLSDEPVLGLWLINVKVGSDYEKLKEFEVAEYTLPKFEVIVTTKPNVKLEDKIFVSYEAKYTYGNSLSNATAVVTVEPRYTWSLLETPNVVNRSENLVNGRGSMEIDIAKDLNIKKLFYQTEILIFVMVKDNLAGREMSSSAIVTINHEYYKLEFITSQYDFKPNMPMNLTLSAKDLDDLPVSDSKNPVIINVTYTYDTLLNRDESSSSSAPSSTVPSTGASTIPPLEIFRPDWWWRPIYVTKLFTLKRNFQNGFASFMLRVPGNVTSLSIVASYQGTEAYHYMSSKPTASNNYIEARVVTPRPSLNSAVVIGITTTSQIKPITYVISAKGKIILSSTLSSNAKSFQFLPTFEMAPVATILVFQITSGGEIISDYVQIEFAQDLRNFVQLGIKSEASPGAEVDISVKSKPKSYVGLLGVDQSVLLLKSGNDLDKSTIFNEISSYGSYDRWNYNYLDNSFFKSFSDFWPGNLHMITNANDEYVRPITISPEIPDVDLQVSGSTTPLPQPVGPGEGNKQPKAVTVRKEFPETWLFECIDNDLGMKNITRKVPDTITSWIITGFSLDSTYGLGLTNSPSKLKVFQPFFVSLNLPYSVKNGEVVAIQVLVFNYLQSKQTADVTLHNNFNEFEFIDPSSNNQQTLNATIEPESGSSVSFLIRPLKVGQITIKVTAVTDSAGDGVENPLLVLPEGVTRYFNKAVFVDLRNSSQFKTNITIEVPADAVTNSTRIEASAVGDILGPSIENLDRLIQMPYGCGEQNMLNFVPNIVVLEYLTSLNKLTPEIEAKCKSFMEAGYQRELTYKHADGSYSAFGDSNGSPGSTWLTAFVLRSFNQASKYIFVDQSSYTQSLSFLTNIQTENGSFPEFGQVFHRDMQGGSWSGVGMTAYILVTFLEIQGSGYEHQKTIDKALAYVIANTENIDDLYTIALVTYALHIANHPLKSSFLAKLDSKATRKSGMIFWEKTAPVEVKNPWDYRPSSVNVEMTAYAMLSYIAAGREVDALPILRWLISQRNENGGFHSTQDTVVGLQALSKLASKIYVRNNNIEITLNYENGESNSLSLNAANALVLQKILLPSSTRNIQVSATGSGFSILQISYKYNVVVVTAAPSFTIVPQVQANPALKIFDLTVCVNFVPNNVTNSSNMAVMEAELPSGYTFDSDSMESLRGTENVAKIEIQNDNTKVVIYFNELTKHPVCPIIRAFRNFEIAEQKQASITVYDYYDTTRKATIFYDPPTLSLCDICERGFCKRQC